MKKLTKFLKDKGLTVLASVLTGNPMAAAAQIADFINTDADEEQILQSLKNNPDLLIKLKELEDRQLERMFDNTKDARRFQAEMSRTTGWLQRNVASIISLTWIIFCIALYWKALTDPNSVNGSIISNITNITMLIVGFYFGSSDK